MTHHHHRHRAPTIGFEPFANPLGVVPGSIDHKFTADIALVSLHDPIVPVAQHPCRRRETQDFCPQIPCSFGQRLGQLCGINIAIIGIIQRAVQIMGFDKRIAIFDLIYRKNI